MKRQVRDELLNTGNKRWTIQGRIVRSVGIPGIRLMQDLDRRPYYHSYSLTTFAFLFHISVSINFASPGSYFSRGPVTQFAISFATLRSCHIMVHQIRREFQSES